MICVSNFDTDGNGYLTKSDVESVTDLGTVFNNQAITNFDEFELFTGIKNITTAPFTGCDNLISVKLPLSIEELGYGVFSGIKGLNDVNLPNLKSISNAVFRGSFIERVTNLGHITKLGSSGESYLFYGCSNLKYIELPSTLKTINYRSIFGLKDLTIVCRAIVPPTIDGQTLEASRIFVPDESLDSYKSSWSYLADKIKPLSEYSE